MPLTCSGPVVVTQDNQVIEDLHIEADGETGVTNPGYWGTILRRLFIEHQNAPGINLGGTNLLVEDVDVVHVGAPASGPNSSEVNNIYINAGRNVLVRRARLKGGSAGVYMVNSSNLRLEQIEGHDFRGPTPRGQFVQWGWCDNVLLEDFSSECAGEIAWTEDNISVFQTSNAVIRRGLLDGNNSPSGIGVMFEHVAGQHSNGLVEDVDAIHMGNGAFSAYPGHNVTFRRVRSKDNICESQQGRGAPSSNALVFAGHPDSTGLRLEEAKYFNLCNPANILWDANAFTFIDKIEEDFVPRAPIRLVFPWE